MMLIGTCSQRGLAHAPSSPAHASCLLRIRPASSYTSSLCGLRSLLSPFEDCTARVPFAHRSSRSWFGAPDRFCRTRRTCLKPFDPMPTGSGAHHFLLLLLALLVHPPHPALIAISKSTCSSLLRIGAGIDCRGCSTPWRVLNVQLLGECGSGRVQARKSVLLPLLFWNEDVADHRYAPLARSKPFL